MLFFPAAVGDGVVDDRAGPREGGDESPWRDSKTRVEDMKKEFACVGVDIAEVLMFFVDDVEAGASNCGVDGDFEPPPNGLKICKLLIYNTVLWGYFDGAKIVKISLVNGER